MKQHQLIQVIENGEVIHHSIYLKYDNGTVEAEGYNLGACTKAILNTCPKAHTPRYRRQGEVCNLSAKIQ